MGAYRPTRHVSVKDVAARSGVSFQTSSKVLNGKGSVSAATRLRILRAAKDLGYVPNLQARSLVMRRTHTVGLVASDFGDHILSRFIVGAEQEARRQGYCVLLTSIEPGGSASDYALPALMERRVDGLLLAASQVEDDRAVARALDPNTPAVSLHHVMGGRVATVSPDHDLTGFLATRHLIEKGHRQIGTISGRRKSRVTQSRLRGYRRALQAAGVPYDDALVEEGNWEIGGAVEATKRLLEHRPNLTAIFAQNDTMAMGVLSAFRTLRKRVPEHCAVVGCDDIDVAAYAAPPLTTIRLPLYETGEQAMRLLLGMISSGSTAPRRVLLPVHLVVRASSGGP